MKSINTILIALYSISSFAQDWISIEGSNYTPSGFLQVSSGWEPGNKQFKVNTFSNWVWFAYDNAAHGFDAQGNYFKFDYTNSSVFVENQNFSTILDFDFTQNNTFLVDRYNGVLKHDGSAWTQVVTGSDWCALSSDIDTVWFARSGSYYLIWEAGVVSVGTLSGLKRIVKKNGEMWGCSGLDACTIRKIVNDVPTSIYSSSSLLLDDKNYDFKFSPHTDTFYTSGDLGISLAYNGVFFDSITPGNTSNMPMAPIREFEFDQYDNIWALFGTDAWNHSHIGYYDQLSKTWTHVYDPSNSPVRFDHRVSIELDSSGNLYVADIADLHVLKIADWPQWLTVLEQQTSNFILYPNPGTGIFNIISSEYVQPDGLCITDLSGKELVIMDFNNEIDLSQLLVGIYLVHSLKDGKILGTKRIVVQ